MKLGRFKNLLIILLLFNLHLQADDKISTVPLINLENLKPSYEEVENDNTEEEFSENYKIKEKR